MSSDQEPEIEEGEILPEEEDDEIFMEDDEPGIDLLIFSQPQMVILCVVPW